MCFCQEVCSSCSIHVEQIETPGWGKEWIDIIGEMKHRWAGHVARMQDGVIVKTAMEWKSRRWWAVERNNSQCERRFRRGAPRKRWEDPLQNYMKAKHGDLPWQIMALDREKWKECRADFVRFHREKG